MDKKNNADVAVFIRKVPADTYRKFKATCAGEGITIQEKIVELMECASAGTILGGPGVVILRDNPSKSK